MPCGIQAAIAHTMCIDGMHKSMPDIVAVAPGSEGEKIDSLEKRIKSLGYNPKVFEDYIKMLDELKPDIAVVACYFGDHAKDILD